MNKTKLLASYALWRARETRWYREWRRLVKKHASTDPGSKRTVAFDNYTHAHEMRKRRATQISKLTVTHLSKKGADFIANAEGIIPYAYNDSRGFATAWIGHLIAMRPVNDADLKKWGSKQHPAARDRVIAFFMKDIAPYEKAVRDVWKKAMDAGHAGPTQEQFDADVSFCFNIGTGGFAGSQHAKDIIAGKSRKQAANDMLLWNKPPEIMGRRKREALLFETGKYTSN